MKKVSLIKRSSLCPIFSDRSPDIDVDSEEDENEDDQEAWSNDELSDSEPTMLDEGGHRKRPGARSKIRPAMNRVCSCFWHHNIATLMTFYITIHGQVTFVTA